MKLLIHLHRLIGLFVGPFFLVAAISGLFYILASLVSPTYYANTLMHTNGNEHKPISMQIRHAKDVVEDAFEIHSVRPAPNQFDVTRVLFKTNLHRQYEYHTVFINPVTLEHTAVLPTYGTSGALPLVSFTDFLHRDLLLGDYGRWYSEVAATWLWFSGLGGLIVFLIKRRTKSYRGRVYRHSIVGSAVVIFLVFLSVTGLTWSSATGAKIGEFRSFMNWKTPSPSRILEKDVIELLPESVVFERVYNAARDSGIDAKAIEIINGGTKKAWFVREIERKIPTNVDSVSIHPATFEIIDQAKFKDFNLAAKLTRWGIDFHMGSLFGITNKLLLILVMIGLIYLIMTGYQLSFKKYLRMKVSIVDIFMELTIKHKVVTILSFVIFMSMLSYSFACILVIFILDYMKCILVKTPKN